ncbi:DUF4331 domain-containing protein [Sphingomonas sabuli]|uniref:DUF4331 domain-containing protein n=1 Tax=Sphingomonas sabuli TaxID=2764186 RepID=A0A7G9KZB3_9SPHN|nr:DUF4331 domain-containing protein [Sphingomonas sabuli]QNM81712.1 DUF4331 domain-containing protein [Sphingomonas sabuli]
MRRSAYVHISAGVALLLTSVSPAFASSHREAPNITKTPKVDNTDVYAFRSYEPGRGAFITLIANFQPGEGPGDGPNYYTMDPDALYEIMIDNNGDAKEDLTYQFKFINRLKNGQGITLDAGGKRLPIAVRQLGKITMPNDSAIGENEIYTVKQVRGDRRSGEASTVTNTDIGGQLFVKPFDNAGNKTFPNYPNYADRHIYSASVPGCSSPARIFVGQREEQFAVNLGPIFDQVNFVPIEGDNDPVYGNGQPFPGGITQSDNNQELINKRNVTSIAIELPIACVTGTGNGVIGVWSSASLPQSRLLRPNPTYERPDTTGGSFVQVSRLGMPLVNEVVIGLPQKDLFNAAEPTQDAVLADYVTNPTYPEYLNILFRDAVNATLGTSFRTLAPTNFPRNDLVATFLTGLASLNQLSTVTASEMLRLNTGVTPTPIGRQRTLGVVADDLAGFPNGRRPGDDVVDIVLRVAMGRLCYPVPINGTPTQLGLCQPSDAPTGQVAYTDGAPSNSNYVMNRFPYLNPPLRGAPRPQNQP